MNKVSKVICSIIIGTLSGMFAYMITHLVLPDELNIYRQIISALTGLIIFVKFYKYLATEDFDHTEEETKKEVKIKYRKKRDYFFKKS